MTRSEPAGWLAPAFAIVAAITALRLGLLIFDRTDLFVDESQYWLWGQNFAFGYYSKPPLIAWVIGAVTTLSGNDSPFWVRAPGPVLHGATALILAALAAHRSGRAAALWVAVTYATLPMVALGSLLMSTDTIMAPFFAAALYFHARLVESRAMPFAILAGLSAGIAFLAKYAAVYFLIGVGLGAVFVPTLRLRPSHWAAMLGAFGLVILPNIVWNMENGFATAEHTMDNVGWLRAARPLAELDAGRLARFFFAQFAVVGPLPFAALLWAAARPGKTGTGLLLVFSVPAIILVCIQALLSKAYGNWAASAYFAGTVIAVSVMLPHRRLLLLSLAMNGTIAAALPVLTLLPDLTLGGTRPVLARYLGRAALSTGIIAIAQNRNLPVVADSRDVIADLFYTGRRSGVRFYALPPIGRPASHYEQTRALPDSVQGPVLFVTDTVPFCAAAPVVAVARLRTAGGAYARTPLAVYELDAGCLHAR